MSPTGLENNMKWFIPTTFPPIPSISNALSGPWHQEPHSEHRWVSKENIPCWAGALISSLLVYREKVALICHPGNCSRNANQFQDKGKPSRSRGAAWRSSQPRRVLATTPQLTGTFQNHSRNFFFFLQACRGILPDNAWQKCIRKVKS